MEKKVSKNFYLCSLITLAPILWLGGGFTVDTLALIGVWAVLVLNHVFLVNIVSELTMSASGNNAGHGVKRILFLMGMKMIILGGTIGIIYFYKKEIISKVILIMIFQLIIQVVSI